MLALITPALACGGFVCDAPNTPVVQNAERIAFHIDEDAGTVEAHVQVFYEGPPDRFAWIVPVAAEPEVFISTDRLFSVANQQLAPIVQLDRRFEGRCGPIELFPRGCGKSAEAAPDDTDFPEEDSNGGVEVVSEGQVGPYDYAVLTASSADDLMVWLTDNNYDIPSQTGDLLAPYLSADSHFLTVRLTKGRDTGDIAPLGWKYAGTEASIPIQLTALAAAPDMGLEVYVFGEHRAVPTSYLHVQVNPANLDWFDGGSNYYDVVSRAADQAGGHAFATDFFGEARLGPFFPDTWDAAISSLRETTSPAEAEDTLNDMGLMLDSNLLAVLDSHAVDTRDWESDNGRLWLDRFSLSSVDLPAFVEDLDQFVFDPLRRVQGLVEQPFVTRLSSSLDAAEMTVDPVFALNADLTERVSNQYTATLVYECNGRRQSKAPRRLELEDGRVYRLPAERDIADDSEYWLDQSSEVDAILIEEIAKEGRPEVIADLTEDAWADVGSVGKGCGCTGANMPYTAGLLVMLGAMMARRRA